jgi:hypothetical protein
MLRHKRREVRAVLAAACALCVAAAPVQAQVRADSIPAFTLPEDTLASTGRLIAGGIMGASLGLLIGGAAGAGLETTLTNDCFDYCGLGGALLGAAVGESLGMAFGVHTANEQRGSYAGAVVGPLAVGLGTLALAIVLDDVSVPAYIVLVGVPVGQLYTSIRGERTAARRRSTPPD